MSEKYYEVIDLQKGNFMDYTREENWTKEDIRVHLIGLFNDSATVEEPLMPEDYPLSELINIYEIGLEEKPKSLKEETRR